MPSTPTSPRRRRAHRMLLAAASLLVAASSVLLAPTTADAAEVDAVTGITITNPPPLRTDAPYVFEATWAVPDSATAGDTFAVDFPQVLEGFASTLDLRDAEGELVATCVVGASSFVCTLTDYVDTHVGVSGDLSFRAAFRDVVTQEQVQFVTSSGTVIDVDTPGGVTVEQRPLPTEVWKYGYFNSDGRTAQWEIVLPGEALAPVGGNPVVLTDAYDPALEFDPSELLVTWIATDDWADYSRLVLLPQGTGPETYALVERPADGEFDVTVHEPVTDGSRIYVVFVKMELPSDVADGDAFGNTVTGATFAVTADPITFVELGGGADGDGLGDFVVTKVVTGSGAAAAAGTTYAVEYAYELDGEPVTGTVEIGDGEAEGVLDVPEGTLVTLSEVAPTVPGVAFDTPVFSGPGVTTDDGSATFRVVDGLVEITLENPASLEIGVGGFEVTKTVTGTGASAAAGATYAVAYAYELDGAPVTGTLQLADGATDAVAGIPVGTVVTLSELAPTVPGVAFGTPVFSGEGVASEGGTATLTVGAGTVRVALENPAALVVPPSTPPVATPPVSTPPVTTPPVATPPTSGALPQTGVSLGSGGVVALAVGSLALGLLLLRRRDVVHGA